MMTNFLLALVLLQSQELGELKHQMDQMRDTLDRHEREISKPICSAELRWVSGGGDRRVPANSASVALLNLFSTVSKPSACLSAEIRVTASYLDVADNLICSGTVENAATQTSSTQSVNLEIRPWNLREFVRWKNEPPQLNSGPKRLACFNPEGAAEATDQELARVASVRVRTTVLPQIGGMSTLEIRLALR